MKENGWEKVQEEVRTKKNDDWLERNGATSESWRKITEAKNSDLLTIRTTGAYASVMKSNYNARVDAVEVLIYNGKSYQLKDTETIQDIIARETIIEFN